jgi:acyl-coenzyme A synthetase/AMP-(fatty) acid ligase
MPAPVSRLFADGRAEREVIAFRGKETLSFGALRARTRHIAETIRRQRIRRVLLVCRDSDAFLTGLLGALHGGAEIVLPPNSQSGAIASLRDSFDLCVTDDPGEPGVVRLVLDGTGGDGELAALEPNDCRVDFFTSGSTGQPKRVAKTLAMLEGEAAVLDRAWGERLGFAPVFGTVSHQHIFGLAFKLLWPLSSGRPFAATVHDVWEALLAELTGPAAIVSSPAHLTRLGGLSPVPAKHRPLLVFTAGAPLPEAAAREAREILGDAPMEIFGSTETGAVAWRGSAAEPWQALPGVKVGIGEAGLLRVRSPYGGEGWCELADRVELQSDERFLLRGRTDRVAKIEGKRVSLPLLEQQLTALPWIEAAAVVPIEEGRIFLGAAVTLSRAGRDELARLGKFRFARALRKALASVQDAAVLPRRWRFVDALPSDGMGKRRSSEIAALLEQRR